MADQQHQSRWQELINKPKGKLGYLIGEVFLLHVHWEAPSMDAAQKLLEGLKQCARATHRDTPCVPVYFFRTSSNNAISSTTTTSVRFVRDLKILQQCKNKVAKGVPRPAVVRDLVDKYNMDESLLDADDDDELPTYLQVSPVCVEFTELYLDERAFLEHSGSKDYLAGYGIILDPSNMNQPPTTIRMGTPPPNVISMILEPALKEVVMPVPTNGFLWKPPTKTNDPDQAIFLLLDVKVPNQDEKSASMEDTTNELVEKIPTAITDCCMLCTAYPHPLHTSVIRVVMVFTSLPPTEALADLPHAMAPHSLHTGEVHTNSTASDGYVHQVRTAFAEWESTVVTVNGSNYVGYVCHAQAGNVTVEEFDKTKLNSL